MVERDDTPHMEDDPGCAMAFRTTVAHAVGLSAAGMIGTIGTTSGFSVNGAFLGLLFGGILSFPWLIALWICVARYASWMEAHPFGFFVLGPIFVLATWWLVVGEIFLDAVAVSCVTSAVLVLLITLLSRRNRSHRG